MIRWRWLMAACGVAAVFFLGARVSAQDHKVATPEKLLIDLDQQLTLAIQQIGQTADLQQRVAWLNGLTLGMPPAQLERDGLRQLVARTLDEISPDASVSFASTITHYPALQPKLLEIAGREGRGDSARLQLIRNSRDHRSAVRLMDQIQTATLRRLALETLARQSNDLSQRLSFLEQAYSIPAPNSSYRFSSIYELGPDAATSPEPICQLIRKHVSESDAVPIYTYFASAAAQADGGQAAAQQYIDAAWECVSKLPEPQDAASMLLRREIPPAERETWVERFDQYILPALRRGQTGIDPLSDLARFDMALLVDRTMQSCMLPLRSFDGTFPSVIERAFSVRPTVVLDWLERGYDQLEIDNDLLVLPVADDAQSRRDWRRDVRDQCVFEITEYLSVHFSDAEPLPPASRDRLCDLAMQVHDPGLRLATLAELNEELRRLGQEVPSRLTVAAQGLLRERIDFPSFDWQQDQGPQLFLLGSETQRIDWLNDRIEQFRGVDVTERTDSFRSLLRRISASGLSASQRLKFYKRIERIAVAQGETRQRAEVAQQAASIDLAWSIRVMFDCLPPDRGRNGKPDGNIGWLPAPSDAGDAIQWLRNRVGDPRAQQVADALLMKALWQYLPEADQSDRDGIRQWLCQPLIRQHRYAAALELIPQINDLKQQTSTRILWVSSLNQNQ
ncbi:hypothetical protein NHH03_18945 [Stieleria sp. TO1_6]|uniref:hypothetical protein n=1 Tax=Stieleria tagensis TaxID=2956795 RepID=UPI00209B89EF|nr:hypothetical protein [Stieleria tagensis]MCO8123830.1 hypothetical protein [Stieleria tagensis]